MIAIADIHGAANLLLALRTHLATLPAHRRVYLGDLIDPHPRREHEHDCAGVIDQVAEDQASGSTDVLAGNHDAFFLIARQAGRDRVDVPWMDGIWYDQGGRETVAAWGFGFSTMGKPHEGALARALDELMTPAQRGVFDNMKIWADHDAYLLVHAGFEPQTPLQKQQARASILDFPSWNSEQSHPLWMRFNPTTNAAPKGRVLVHGHTPTRSAIIGKKRICIDTGVKYGGPLTALEIVSDQMRLHQAWPAGMDAATWKKDGMR
ncbi:MAG: metallophosphoesterase [Magnetospirillum sp.]|nr:metallophosphoesterase [Magnetospirillum sp.]